VALELTVTFKVEAPVVVLTGLGVKPKVVLDPPEALKVTVLFLPATAPTFTVNEELLVPRVTVKEDDDMPIVKSVGGACTVSETVVVCVIVPSVPLIVRGIGPTGVEEVVRIVSVDDPAPPETGFELNEHVAFAGQFGALRVTL
jgi:hypothetical protein